MRETVHVAVGVILDGAGRVLVARRPPGVHLEGLWEFPGGKLEAGESVLEALARELLEELGIRIDPGTCFPLRKIHHQYPGKRVLLDVWTVAGFSGTPLGRERQVLAWMGMDELQPAEFPPANAIIIDTLRLPRMLAITGEANTEAELLHKSEAILARGIRLLQLRQPGLPAGELLARAASLTDLCETYGARLILNTIPDTFSRSRAHGLHLGARQLMSCRRRPFENRLLSAACHSLQELEHAEAIGVDFVLLSPVHPTSSHPGAPALGWHEFRRLAGSVSLPVFALGGLGAEDLHRSILEGAHGVASITAFWPQASAGNSRDISKPTAQ